MNTNIRTHLGQFLRSLREQRGFQSIQEYVRRYNLPVSYVYYTEVESGKKRIALDTSKQLCAALEADQISFYYHLLQDILPPNIQDEFLSRIPIQEMLDKKGQESKAQSIKDAYQKNQLSRLNKKISYMNDEQNAYLLEHPDLFPIVCAIYCVSSTSDKELAQMVDRLGIAIPIETILAKFEDLGLIKVTPGNGNIKLIAPAHEIIVTSSQTIFAGVINKETETTISESSDYAIGSADQANCFHGMLGLSKQQQEELRTHIADLDAEFDAYHLVNPDGVPQLMTIVFSPAKEYKL